MVADPERLTRYECFRNLTVEQRKAIAETAEEVCFYQDHTLFKEGAAGETLFLLHSGEVQILYNIGEGGPAQVDTVSGNEVLGCSVLIEPFTYTSTARALTQSEALALDAAQLRVLMEQDCSLGYSIQKRLMQMLLDRITDLRLGS